MTAHQHRASGQLTLPRLVDRLDGLPRILQAAVWVLATNWVFTKIFGRSLFGIGDLPLGYTLAGALAVLVVSVGLPLVGMLACWPARGVGGSLRWALRVLRGPLRRDAALDAGWVPLPAARQVALAERDKYWTSRVDAALAAYAERAATLDRVELQAFALIAVLVMDLGCPQSVVLTILHLGGISCSAGGLACLYAALASVWCWGVSREASKAAIIYHPVLAQQLIRERQLRRPARGAGR